MYTGEIVEGIDYIFDRYAFLNVPPNATSEVIRTEIRKKRAANHPDKLTFVSDEIKVIAQRQLEFVDQCERILMDETLRPLYDSKLAEFKAKEPELVSTSGQAIISTGKFRVDVNYLISEDSLDFSALSTLSQQCGYNEKRLVKARKQYEQDKDEENREELYAQLNAKLVYFSVLEDFYWQKAGVTGAVGTRENFMAQSMEEIENKFKQKLDSINSHIEQAVQDRNGSCLLGFAKPLLLTNSSGSEQSFGDNSHQLVEMAVKGFEVKAEELKKLMSDKKEVMDELLTVSRRKQIKSNDSNIYDIFLFTNPNWNSDDEVTYLWPEDNFELVGIALRADVESQSVTNFTYLNNVLTQEDIKNWPHNIYVLEANLELGTPLVEAVHLAQELCDKHNN